MGTLSGLQLPESVHAEWDKLAASAGQQPALDRDARSKLEQLAQQSEEAATLAVRELSERLQKRKVAPVRGESGVWELRNEDRSVWAPNVRLSELSKSLGRIMKQWRERLQSPEELDRKRMRQVLGSPSVAELSPMTQPTSLPRHPLPSPPRARLQSMLMACSPVPPHPPQPPQHAPPPPPPPPPAVHQPQLTATFQQQRSEASSSRGPQALVSRPASTPVAAGPPSEFLALHFSLRWALLLAGGDTLPAADLCRLRVAFAMGGPVAAAEEFQRLPRKTSAAGTPSKPPLACVSPSKGKVVVYGAVFESSDTLLRGHPRPCAPSLYVSGVAHRKLGDRLLRVNFKRPTGAEESQHRSAETQLLKRGFKLAGRHYDFFADKETASWFLAVDGPGVDGGDWLSVQDARGLFGAFTCANSVAKMAARIELMFTPTITHDFSKRPFEVSDLRGRDALHHALLGSAREQINQLDGLVRHHATLPGGAVRIMIVDDVYATTADGTAALNADGKLQPMTDGNGWISRDLAELIPQVQAGLLLEESGSASHAVAPLFTQGRLWVEGSVAKGVWTTVDGLPASTIVVSDSMLKLPLECARKSGVTAANEGWFSFEVYHSSLHKLPREAQTNEFLLHLLEHGGGTPMTDVLLRLQKDALEQLCSMSTRWRAACAGGGFGSRSDLLRVCDALAFDTRDDSVSSPAEMIISGFTPDEPYIRDRLKKAFEKKAKAIREGRFIVPHSHSLVGISDPSGSLPAGTVCVLVNGASCTGDVLVYRSPGCHPGDVRKLSSVSATPELSRLLGDSRDRSRYHGIIFSVAGERATADTIDGSDFDGDIFTVISHEEVVACFQQSAPRPDEPTANTKSLSGEP